MMNVNYFFHNKYFDYLLEDSVMNPNTKGKDWYKNLRKDILLPEKANQMLESAMVRGGESLLQIEGIKRFYLKTTYPGLLIGSGNSHDVSQVSELLMENETDWKKKEQLKKLIDPSVKLSIHLDYVNGLPMIPASSVKGMLRSAFEYHSEYVAQIMYQITNDEKWDKEDAKSYVKQLLHEIFDYGDVFFDAVPVKGGKDNHILGFDYITSHKHKKNQDYDGLVSPNPVKMMKVIPNVVFAFAFICKDSENASGEQKIELFQTIIEDLGIGAKTNTGFGVMEAISSKECEIIKSSNNMLAI